MLIDLWSLVIIVSAVLSWIPNLDPYHPAVTTVRRIADLICDPIRRIVPMGSLGIDLSPLLAILLLQFTNQFVVASLRGLAARLG
jgi:YggT family protein